MTVGVGSLAIVAIQIANALGESAFGPYLAGMLWLLTAAALQFYRLLRH